MTKIISLYLLVLSQNAFSQKVVIKGTAFDTTNGRSRVYVVLNDTLRKFRENKLPDWEVYRKLVKDTTVALFAGSDGKFQIAANITDTLLFQSFRHIPQAHPISSLVKMRNISIRLEPEVCVPYLPCNDTLPSEVYIFVGQKLSLNYEKEPYYCDVEIMDNKFNAAYRILQQIAGKFPTDTIRFAAFDHYGRPAFSQYENVLLFVSKYCDELYHEKYQYFDLYRTADGKWASPGDPYKYDTYHRKSLTAQNIQFADSVWFNISKLGDAAIKQQFPAPYYTIKGEKAIPVMGCYITELIAVKKEGVLKARKNVLD